MSEPAAFISALPDTSRFFGTWPKVDSWSEVTPLMALSDLDLNASPTDRMRSDSQCSSGTSVLLSDPFGSAMQSPRSMASDRASPETRARQRLAESEEQLPERGPGVRERMFSAGAGVDFNLLTDEIERERADPAMEKLSVLIKYLSATSAPLVTVDRLMWLDLLIFVQRRCQLMAEKDIALCVFCRNNNEPRSMYMNHKVRDRDGRVSCPVLRRYECPLCHQSGDNAHTLKYCPLASSGQALMTTSACFRTPRNAVGRRRLL